MQPELQGLLQEVEAALEEEAQVGAAGGLRVLARLPRSAGHDVGCGAWTPCARLVFLPEADACPEACTLAGRS